MLKTKCILAPKKYSDGLRISVMSRHTLEDGTTPNVEITGDSFDVHRTEFAPPLRLIGDHYKRDLTWEKFESRYLNYLENVYEQVRQLAESALTQDITLLCIEESPKRCHRRLLAEECTRLKPKLEIIIK